MQARRLPAERGTYWLLEGFRLFRRNPPFITALVLTYLLIVQSLTLLLPGIGPVLLPLLLPVMTLIVANGCRLTDEGQRPGKEALLLGLAGKDANPRGLLRLGGLQLIAAVLLVLISSAIGSGDDPLAKLERAATAPVVGMDSSAPGSADAATAAATPAVVADDAPPDVAALHALLQMMLLAAPMIIAFWFAPFLVGWDRVAPLKSLFFSAIASWRNWRAMGMFTLAAVVVAGILPGLILIVFSQIAGLSPAVALIAMRMLLIFLIAPVLTASIYISYRDIFRPAVDENA
jgi:hypothetical protein